MIAQSRGNSSGGDLLLKAKDVIVVTETALERDVLENISLG